MRELGRDGRWRLLMAVMCGLLLLAVVSNWQAVRASHRHYAVAQQLEMQSVLAQGERNPHDAAHFGQFVFKPLAALALFDPGLSSYLGTVIWLEAHTMNFAEYQPAEDLTEAHRFARLTVAWVLQYLLSLWIILLGYAAFAGERKRGTLRLLASLGISPRQMLAGKLLGGVVALGAVVLLGLGFALLFLAGLREPTPLPATTARGWLMALSSSTWWSLQGAHCSSPYAARMPAQRWSPGAR